MCKRGVGISPTSIFFGRYKGFARRRDADATMVRVRVASPIQRSMVAIRPVKLESADVFKMVRLRALADSPTAFGSTFAKESLLTTADWQQRAANSDGVRSITFLAWRDNEPCGIAAGFLDAENSLKGHLVSVWVAPENRGMGLGKLLVNSVISWAKSRNIETLCLMVTSVNPLATFFYESMGFKKTGKIEDYPNDPDVIEYEMAIEL